MKHKYFQITEQSTLDHIANCLASISTRESSLAALAEKLGARQCLQFNGGGVAAFSFNGRPDKAVWKVVKHGFMPKVKTDENKLLEAIPRSIDYRDTIKKYGFGGEMLIGDQAAGGGFRMHSSFLKGNKKTGFYAINVPYQGEFDREVHSSLLEIKEWEMLKGMDSSE